MIDNQIAFVVFNELAGSLTGVVTCAILDQDDGPLEVRKQVFEKSLGAVTVEPIFKTLVNELSAEELNRAKHFISFPDTSGFDLRLLADWRPCV